MEVAVNARNLCTAPKVTRVRSNSHESDCGTQWTLATVSEADLARYLPTGSIENERDGEKDAESEVSLGAEGTVSGVTSDSLESDCRTQWTKAEASEADSTRPAPTGSNKNEKDADKGAEVSRKAQERDEY